MSVHIFMKVLLVIVASTVAVSLILLLIRLKYDRSVKQIWRSLKTQPSGLVFTKDMVAGLDEPVQRYFLHAIAPGTPLAAYVELEMSGSIRMKPDADWQPMQASQIVAESGGFVWQANVGNSLMSLNGADYYAQHHGRVKFSLWGLIPLVDAQSNDVDRSSIGRLCVEYVWLPSALLPHNGVAWQAIDRNNIQASFEIDNEPITLNLSIDNEGRLLNLSIPRWADATEDKNWQYIPFGGEIAAEQTFGGYTVPSKMDAGYWFGTDKYWTFFQATIEQASFY